MSAFSTRSFRVSQLVYAAAVLSALLPAVYAEKIPLCPGLTIVGAVHDGSGDYESITRLESLNEQGFTLRMSAQRRVRSAIRHVRASRTVFWEDKTASSLLIYWFNPNAPMTIPGSTSPGTSTAVLRALKSKGIAEISVIHSENSGLSANRNVHPNLYDYEVRYKLQRVGNGPVMLPVTVNGKKLELPAIQARGDYLGETAEFFFLDDESNPMGLKFSFSNPGSQADQTKRGQVVKITYHCPDSSTGGPVASPPASRLEQALVKAGRVEVYDIYFDFNSDRIREESEPTLQEIAEVLRRHPDWKLSIEGHTDNIGSETANLDLSRRRAASVKNALAATASIDGNRLATAGYGESHPKDSNDTLEGRARNRRVELVRQ